MTTQTNHHKLPILPFICGMKKQNEPKVGEASLLRYHSPRPEGTSLFWLLQIYKTKPIPLCGKEKQNEPNYLRFQPKNKDYQKNEPNSNPNLFI
jgi:hypothetical protein